MINDQIFMIVGIYYSMTD